MSRARSRPGSPGGPNQESSKACTRSLFLTIAPFSARRIVSSHRDLRRRLGMASARTGGCLCGAIRYESGGEPQFALQCHCRDCQRASGSGYVAAVRMPSAEFRITKGAPKRYVAKSDAGNEITRAFCGDCGAPLYVHVSTRPDLVGIRVPSFDDP